MRKQLLFSLITLVLFLSISPNTFADDLTCQYKENVIDKEEIKMFPFDKNGNQLSDILIEVPNEYDRPIKAINPNAVDVSGYIDIFVLAMYSGAGYIPTTPKAYECDYRSSVFRRYNFTVSAFSSTEIYQPSNSIPAGTAYCNIYKFTNNYTLSYYNTEYVDFKSKNVITYKDVCKQCNGKNCLNSGEKCSLDSECGSTICNIVGVCDNKKIIPCPNGLLNCNNISCIAPSVKKSGEGYSCEFECESGRGENGVCKRAQVWNYIFVALGVIASSVILSILYHKINGDRIRLTEAEIRKHERELMKLNADIRNKELIVEQEKLKNELAKKESEDIKELEKLLEEKRKLEGEIQTPYVNDQGYGVWNNPKKEGYQCRYFKDSFFGQPKSEILFHRWFYEQNKGGAILDGEEIHHINRNKYDNRITNLIKLTREQHKHIDHSRIIMGNRDSGIRELRRVGIRFDISSPIQNRK